MFRREEPLADGAQLIEFRDESRALLFARRGVRVSLPALAANGVHRANKVIFGTKSTDVYLYAPDRKGHTAAFYNLRAIGTDPRSGVIPTPEVQPLLTTLEIGDRLVLPTLMTSQLTHAVIETSLSGHDDEVHRIHMQSLFAGADMLIQALAQGDEPAVQQQATQLYSQGRESNFFIV